MTALGSYNQYNNNFVKDCIFISTTNSLTSLYSGFAIFSVLGFMAQEQGVPIATVAESGPGLVFIAYPKAVMQMPLAPLWAVLFFFMIILMGLDSQFVGVEGFITAVVDLFPSVLRVGQRREWFIAAVSVISFFIGLTMVTRVRRFLFSWTNYDYPGENSLSLCFTMDFEGGAVFYPGFKLSSLDRESIANQYMDIHRNPRISKWISIKAWIIEN